MKYQNARQVTSPVDAHSVDSPTDEGWFDTGQAARHGDRFAQLKYATIMMVDDEPIMMDVIQTFLEDEGYRNFVTTDQSTQAMGLIFRERPDVVLLDLMMPEVTGFDILKAMRSDREFEHVPVIVLTSSTDADTKLKVLELGATDFLAKPVDPSELALRLRNTLAAKAYQDHLAYYDVLTGLPNRRMLLDRLSAVLADARRDQKAVAMLHIGLDRFKEINDTLGPKAGDGVLKGVAQRLERYVQGSDAATGMGWEVSWRSPSRLGGDEFVVMLPQIHRVEDAARLARRILALVEEPFYVGGNEVFVTLSIGIAVFPNDGEETDTLVKHAGIATRYAKQQGRSTYRFYSKEINARSLERLRFENDLRRALINDELLLYYQPKVDTGTGRVTGVEALLRWNHPEHGIVLPDEFISLAEETGLIVAMGEWVLNEACRQARAWQSAGLDMLSVAVNVSSQQFRQCQLTGTIQAALEGSGLDPRHLTLELTESMIMDNAKGNTDILHQMKEMGLKLSIDDFGTGYSSLSYLKRFPLDELKIDRSFISDLDTDADDAAIVTAIIAMGHGLGLSVVAEGVEAERQLAFLKQRGCEGYQGYLFSRPLAADDLYSLIGFGATRSVT